MDNFSFLDQQLHQLLLRISKDLGCPPDKTQRILLEQLVHHVSTATREGKIALPLSELEPVPDIEALNSLPVLGQPGDYRPLIIEDDHIWLNRYWQYENRLAHNLWQRLKPVDLSAAQTDHVQTTLMQWHSENGEANAQTDWQQRAVALAACSHFSIISGGPGTGKTTTVTRLLWLLTAQLQIKPVRILLAAPTGKAAMRLQESIRQAKATLSISTAQAEQIPEHAATLHRLLGYIPGKISFRHNQHNTLPADVVIVDEASMIDISLMTRLFDAVPQNARLILLGDKDQLASVETGSVFRDLCAEAANRHSDWREQQLNQLCGNTYSASENIATHNLDDHIVVLQKSWRFSRDSGIGQLAAAVRDGEKKHLIKILQQDWTDISWTEDSELQTEQLHNAWQEYFALLSNPPERTQQRNDWLQAIFSAFNRFRILTPMRQGPFGTVQLNQQLGQVFRRQQAGATGNVWYTGRPVMVTQNDYRQQLFNGDIGLTLKDEQGELRIWFPDEEGFRAVSPVRLPNHETAWAMTIHKSQGSEFDDILLLLPDNEEVKILGRELLYTGITRAKSNLRLQGKASVLQAAIKRVTPPSSRIRQRIKQAD
ncbi:MAG: exodeoxyribonuclease V subunit alpha [Thiolinea sp.]